MSKKELISTHTPVIPEETWMLQEARTIGLTFLHAIPNENDPNEFTYIFIHRFNIVRIRFTVNHSAGIYVYGNVEQIGNVHYKEGEFEFDARPKCGPVFALHDEREILDDFFAILNKKLLEMVMSTQSVVPSK